MIRISSQQVFSSGISRLQELNASLNKTQQQIATGKKVNQPSDDPVAAARILKLDQEVTRIETYQRNASLAQNRLQQEESALASAVDLVQRIRELTVQAGNGSLSANDRSSIAEELKQRLDQLADIANTQDASGEYIFSGFQGDQPAFVKQPDGTWRYNGDEGQRVLEIDDGVTVAISDHGKGIFVDVPAAVSVKSATVTTGHISDLTLDNSQALRNAFGGAVPDDLTVVVAADGSVTVENRNVVPPDVLTTDPSPLQVGEEFEVAGLRMTVSEDTTSGEFTIGISDKQSVFGTIETLIAGLESLDKTTPDGQAAYDALIAESLINLDNAQESLILKQTELGGRLNAVESTQAFLEDSGLYTKEIRSELEDLDYAEAISNLSFQSFVLEAAQQSFAQVAQLSLFDRL
jgi:flagellar hook-associated protein 3 FlgL